MSSNALAEPKVSLESASCCSAKTQAPPRSRVPGLAALTLALLGTGAAGIGALASYASLPPGETFAAGLAVSAAGWTAALGAFILALMAVSRRTEFFTHSLGLDFAVSCLTWVPPVASGILLGWPGALGAFGAQLVVLIGFSALHALAHPEAGPTIRATLNRLVGSWANYIGLAATVIAVPVFWLVRAAEVFAYPLLVWSLGFPRYNTRDWVNVSRQKFTGLVGHDLVWCLYCDWMTGVYSLGGEMLRNVESFWCPIRFYSGPKCDNCQLHFPDLKTSWVPADSDMKAVKKLMDDKYRPDGPRSWFGHPERGAKIVPVAASAETAKSSSVAAPAALQSAPSRSEKKKAKSANGSRKNRK